MTDRAEIERLLNQTGRTLEKLPAIYSKTEAVAAVAVAGETILQIGNLLLHRASMIELLVGALRDALTERDAAIIDLPRMCYLCKHYFSNPMIKDTKLGKMIIHCDKNCGDARFWEWRGAEEGGD